MLMLMQMLMILMVMMVMKSRPSSRGLTPFYPPFSRVGRVICAVASDVDRRNIEEASRAQPSHSIGAVPERSIAAESVLRMTVLSWRLFEISSGCPAMPPLWLSLRAIIGRQGPPEADLASATSIWHDTRSVRGASQGTDQEGQEGLPYCGKFLPSTSGPLNWPFPFQDSVELQ
jgi:hypothetical protein